MRYKLVTKALVLVGSRVATPADDPEEIQKDESSRFIAKRKDGNSLTARAAEVDKSLKIMNDKKKPTWFETACTLACTLATVAVLGWCLGMATGAIMNARDVRRIRNHQREQKQPSKVETSRIIIGCSMIRAGQ